MGDMDNIDTRSGEHQDAGRCLAHQQWLERVDKKLDGLDDAMRQVAEATAIQVRESLHQREAINSMSQTVAAIASDVKQLGQSDAAQAVMFDELGRRVDQLEADRRKAVAWAFGLALTAIGSLASLLLHFFRGTP